MASSLSEGKRKLRSTTKMLASTSSTSVSSPRELTPSPFTFTFTTPTTPAESKQEIQFFPHGSKLPHLSKAELLLLRRKQAKLRSTAPATLESLSSMTLQKAGSAPTGILQDALLSTLIFVSHEAGTAVSVSPHGWILTCAHCFADSPAEYEALGSKRKWLLAYDGGAVCVECRFWDGRRDLALCKVVGMETERAEGREGEEEEEVVVGFRYLSVATERVKVGTSMICIGQPGADDLESASARKTKYNLIEISQGSFRGLVKGADVQVNEEIGSLKHDCWTYWGHSGAPLVEVESGKGRLVGIHSSWDDQTAMRHGVPGVAIGGFLQTCQVDLGLQGEEE